MGLTALVAALGAGLGLAVVLLAAGLRPSAPVVKTSQRWPDLKVRLLRAGAAGAVVLVLTRWPVLVLGACAAGFFAADVLGARAAREREMARMEAIAAWTEMLRDTLVAAHGLEEAVEVTADIAPAPIRAEIRALAIEARRGQLASALRDLGVSLGHPVGDLVVVALRQSAEGQATELGPLLATLAVAAREEAAMRQRVEAGRARTRTSVRIIVGATVVLAAFVGVLNRNYLDAYASAFGQVMLAVAVGFAGVAFWWLASMSRYQAPERFLAAPSSTEGER